MYFSLQIGRAIAAILVVLFHLGGAMSSDRYFNIKEFYAPFSFGGSGVEFFFVLSGFIIYNAHRNDLSHPHKLWSYIKKRLIRIFPTYWIVFSVVYMVAFFTSSSSVLPTDMITIVKSLFLVPQDVNVVGGTGAPVIAVAWSLQYEVLFYVFFAFLILNKFTIIGFFLLIISIYIHYFGVVAPFPMSVLVSDYVLLFIMGIITAKVTRLSLNNFYIKFSGLIGLILFITLALDIILGYGLLKVYKILLSGLSSSLIILYIVKIEEIGYDFKRFRLLNLFGDASYSLYLIHYPVIVILCKVFVILGLVESGLIVAFLLYIFMFIMCVSLAVLFHIRIEKPVINFLNKAVK